MSMQLVVNYNDQPVIYNVFSEEKNIYRLCLDEAATSRGPTYIPNKINIRRKGKIWISDLEDDDSLVKSLMHELNKFSKD